MKNQKSISVGMFYLYTFLALTFLYALVFKSCRNSDDVDDKNVIKPEYTIELLNQTEVLIQTPDTIYKTTFEQIEETIQNDNQ